MNTQRALDLLRRSKPELIEETATRNYFIHGYLGIDDDTLWNIIRDDVPELLPLSNLLKNEASS